MSDRPLERLYLEEGEEREEVGREGRTKREVGTGPVERLYLEEGEEEEGGREGRRRGR